MNNVGIKNGSYSDRSQSVSQTTPQGKSQSGSVAVLKEGQTVTGEVIDLIGKDVTIALEGGGKLKAHLADNAELQIGMRATFDVAEADASKILLKIMTDPGASGKNPVIDKALVAAGLADNPRNREAVEALLDRGMSIDKASVHKFLAASAPYSGVSMSTVAELLSNDIPLNPINVYGYESYKANEAGLRADLAALAEQIETIAQDFPEVAEQLIAVLTGEEGAGESAAVAAEAEAAQAEGAVREAGSQADDIGAKDAASADTAKTQGEGQASAETGSLASQEAAEGGQTGPAGQVTGKGTEAAEAARAQSAPESGAAAGKPDNAVSQQVAQTAESGQVAAEQNTEAQTIAQGPEGEQAHLTRETVGEGQKTDLQQGDPKAAAGTDGAAASSVLSREDEGVVFNLKSLVMNTMTLKAEELKKKTASEYFEKTARKLNALKEIAEQMGEKGGKLSEAVSKALDDMQFQRDLNMVFSYVQLPVKFTGGSEGEVHVYARKRRLSDSDNISVLLHLKMDALGQLDIHMSLQKKDLKMTMYTEDDESMRLLKESMDALRESLEELGFTANIGFQKREEMEPPVKELLAGSDVPGHKRYSFDIRA